MYEVNVFLKQSFNFCWHVVCTYFRYGHIFVLFCLFRRYLTRELTWHSQSSTRPSKMVFLLFENDETLERASVSLLMLSAKQGHMTGTIFNIFGMRRPLSGIEPWTSRTQSEHSTTRLYRRFCIQLKKLIWVNVLHKNMIWLENVTVDICCAKYTSFHLYIYFETSLLMLTHWIKVLTKPL